MPSNWRVAHNSNIPAEELFHAVLVPAFSSKGFRFKGKKDETSEVKEAMDTAGVIITDQMLVSAYDMHYGYIKGTPQAPKPV
jgi:hypothetical protein